MDFHKKEITLVPAYLFDYSYAHKPYMYSESSRNNDRTIKIPGCGFDLLGVDNLPCFFRLDSCSSVYPYTSNLGSIVLLCLAFIASTYGSMLQSFFAR
jgi:hypothetical protein